MRKSPKAPIKAFTAFSLYTNFKDLIKTNHSIITISCIDGIKVLAAGWIIIGHRVDFMKEPFPGRWYQDIVLWDRIAIRMIAGYFYCVETFLACSAILVTQSMLKSFDR